MKGYIIAIIVTIIIIGPGLGLGLGLGLKKYNDDDDEKIDKIIKDHAFRIFCKEPLYRPEEDRCGEVNSSIWSGRYVQTDPNYDIWINDRLLPGGDLVGKGPYPDGQPQNWSPYLYVLRYGSAARGGCNPFMYLFSGSYVTLDQIKNALRIYHENANGQCYWFSININSEISMTDDQVQPE